MKNNNYVTVVRTLAVVSFIERTIDARNEARDYERGLREVDEYFERLCDIGTGFGPEPGVEIPAEPGQYETYDEFIKRMERAVERSRIKAEEAHAAREKWKRENAVISVEEFLRYNGVYARDDSHGPRPVQKIEWDDDELPF